MALLTPSTLAGPVQAPAGGGTTGTLPKWASANTLADSILAESSAVIQLTAGSLLVRKTAVSPSAVSQQLIHVIETTAGATAAIVAEHQTAGSNAHAAIIAAVFGATGGDPNVAWLIPGAATWTAGLDNSDSDKWKLAASGTLGTTNVMEANALGRFGIGPGVAPSVNAGQMVRMGGAATGVRQDILNEHAFNASGSDAYWYSLVAGTSGGDPGCIFDVNGGSLWTIGVDNSVSDNFVIGTGLIGTAPIVSITTAGVTTIGVGDLYLARSTTGNVILTAENDSNTSAAHAYLRALVAGTSGGDPGVIMDVNGGSQWTLGVDNSDSDSFKIGTGLVGVAPLMKIATGGNVTFLGNGTVVGINRPDDAGACIVLGNGVHRILGALTIESAAGTVNATYGDSGGLTVNRGSLIVTGGSGTGVIDLGEFNTTTDPAAPADNRVYLYCRDNGAGKEQLCAKFNTGAVQVLATEP